jgi:hypothetical protein
VGPRELRIRSRGDDLDATLFEIVSDAVDALANTITRWAAGSPIGDDALPTATLR